MFMFKRWSNVFILSQKSAVQTPHSKKLELKIKL
jgi:hypothetical protein